MKPFYKIISLGVFPYDVLFCCGMSTDDVRVYVQKKYNIKLSKDENKTFEHNDSCRGKTIFLENNKTILWLKNPPKTCDAIATLAHESFHAAGFIIDSMGVTYSHDNDEILCYISEYIVEEVLNDFSGKRLSK